MVASTHTKLKKYWTVRTFEWFLNTRKTAIQFLKTKLIKNGHCYKIYSNFKVVSHFKKIYFREEKNNSYRVIRLFINKWGLQRFLPLETGHHILLFHGIIFISVVLRVILMLFRIGCNAWHNNHLFSMKNNKTSLFTTKNGRLQSYDRGNVLRKALWAS